MYKITLFVCLGIACTPLTAQETETAFAAARYTFLYMTDTTKPNEITSENMILYLGKNSSLYKSYDKVLRDSAMKEQMVRLKTEAASGGGFNIQLPPGKPGSTVSFYKNISRSKLNRVEYLLKNYLIEEELPAINWTVMQETKDIGGLSCQKATAAFRGRNYTAWFSAQLPYSNGPWKLGGLPGLIVEAADENNQVVFRFTGFEDVSSKNISVMLPADGIKATDKEFTQLKEMATKDPQAFINTALAGMPGGGSIKINNISGGTFTSNGDSKKKMNNNPMERIAQ
jgi:GLPGLI family protein